MSSSSATVAVDKATSDLLIGPDWTMNIDICDSINSHRWQAKDVVKALKKRLQHRNPKVQLLALTLLETMVKNCGDIVHFQIADRNILQEMIKIVRKKMDMHVRDKILVLLDSWQEAFGGAGGKYPQYYWAYEELRRSGVQFPERSRDAAPIFTPPVAPSVPRHSQAGYGMPSDTSRRLDEAMASQTENLSFSNLDSMRSVQELLSDMLQAVNPTDREAIKDEVIVDLVSQCRSNQKKLMQMVASTGDERLLGQGLELNDNLQSVLAKHDAIASGSSLAKHDAIASGSPLAKHDAITSGSPLPAEVIINSASPVPTEVRDASPRSNPAATSIQLEEEEEEDDDFAQLARRRTKASAMSSETSVQGDGAVPPPSTSSPSNALVLTSPPPAVRTSTATKEQDIIDLLSITLSTTSVSPHAPQSNTNQPMNQVPFSTTSQGNPYGSQVYTESQGQAAYSNYVAPWAQPQPQQWAAQQAPPQPQPWSGQQSQPRPQQWAAQQSQPQPQQWAAQQSQHQPQQWDAQQPQPWAEQQAQPQPQQMQPRVQHQAQPQPQQMQPRVQHQAQPQEARVQPQPWAEQQAPKQPQQPQPQAQAQHQAQSQAQPWAQHQPQSQPQQPWAQPESQPQPQPWMLQEARTQTQPQSQHWGQQQAQGQSQSQAWAQQHQSQPKVLAPQQSFNYPPPPWATATTTTTQVAKSLQSHNSFPARVSNGVAFSEGQSPKPFIPSYRLFEDLNVLGGSDGTSNNSTRMSGQSMLGGRK